MSLYADEVDIESSASEFNAKAASKGLTIKELCRCEKRVLILVYSEKLMKERLSDVKTADMLGKMGYNGLAGVDEYLDRLSERIGEKRDFPHEIGLFLDYPPEDVEGFIENKGENFKLCGMWKVYGNVENAKRKFTNYDKCRNFLCNKLSEGLNIYQALRIS
jgi:hypothetical protein